HVADINNTFLYLDPPYYSKGKQLYLNNYGHDGHLSLATKMQRVPHHLRWLISYDNTDAIKQMYSNFRLATFDLNYTLQSKKFGSELLIFSDNLTLGTEIIVNSRSSTLEVFRYQQYESTNSVYITQ